MIRRLHIPALTLGKLQLPASQAHHLRDVLRLTQGDLVQAFDDAGNTAEAIITGLSAQSVEIMVQQIDSPRPNAFHLTIAAAVPKAARADWMIEKLSELGVDEYIPLAVARSVSLPEGAGKLGRWGRIATEAAKQSRRQGVMRISPLIDLRELLDQTEPVESIWCLSLGDDARPISELARDLPGPLTLLVGPEGGWTEEELRLFTKKSLLPVKLTHTVLRIETAAIAAAAIVKSLGLGSRGSSSA